MRYGSLEVSGVQFSFPRRGLIANSPFIDFQVGHLLLCEETWFKSLGYPAAFIGFFSQRFWWCQLTNTTPALCPAKLLCVRHDISELDWRQTNYGSHDRRTSSPTLASACFIRDVARWLQIENTQICQCKIPDRTELLKLLATRVYVLTPRIVRVIKSAKSSFTFRYFGSPFK